MKHPGYFPFIQIAGLVLAAAAAGYFLATESTLYLTVAVPIVLWLAWKLMRTFYGTHNDLKRFVNAIQFSEFNISFRPQIRKGPYRDQFLRMEKAVKVCNERMQAREGRISFYDMLLNKIDFALIVADNEGKIVWINRTAIEIVGKPQPRCLKDIQKLSGELYNALGELLPGVIRIVRLQQTEREHNLALSSTAATIRGEELKIIAIKDIQPVLDETESNAWKKLIRILTHEIMNSVTPLISLSETFSDEQMEPDETMKKAMQAIYRRSKGLIRFVDNYKRITQVPAPNPEVCNLKEMIEDIDRLLRSQGIRFTYSLQPQTILMKADRGQLEQVLINLIKNAWEACKEKESPQVNIAVTLDERQQPGIVVEDNGEGILLDVLDKVFIPFFTTKKEGSGIGLALCRQIILAHHGKISIQSRPNEGTRVRISFGASRLLE